MAKRDFCINCSEDIPFGTKICPFCGFNEEEFMNTPTEKPKRKAFQPKPKKVKKPMFTNAEALALGIYPHTESYKRSIMGIMYDEE